VISGFTLGEITGSPVQHVAHPRAEEEEQRQGRTVKHREMAGLGTAWSSCGLLFYGGGELPGRRRVVEALSVQEAPLAREVYT